MEQGYKHFSHPHNLMMHEMPEGIEVSCSGCNSCSSGTVYVCWQCNFFLHEQCHMATRSMTHPSHPPHPLTLVPYPTYPSNSFYCNSCKIIGTGFSYSCSDCDFDLHVQCAYSISIATSLHNARDQYTTNYYVPDQEQALPGWNGQNPYSHSYSIPPDRQNSFNTPYIPSTSQYGPSDSIPTNSHYPIPSAHYPSVDQTGPPVSTPANFQNPITSSQYSSMAQTGPSVSIPITSQNSIPGAQYPSTSQPKPSDSAPDNHQIPITNTQVPSIPQKGSSVSNPTKNQIPNSSVQNSNMDQNIPAVSVPGNQRPENHVESGQSQLKDKEIYHFSHPHNLKVVNLQQDEENKVACSGCEEDLIGKGYSCVEPNCEFHLHETCFNLKRVIQHKSHPEHPLTLLSIAPYNNENGEFTCNACFSDGTGFTYHCSVCKYDLHIPCVSLPETMKRSDHEHVLKLFYSVPAKSEKDTFSCDVCHGDIQKDRWTYYCESCDYGTHLGCVDCEECEPESPEISVVEAQAQLQRLQLQMEMARQNAQFMASLGASLVNLV